LTHPLQFERKVNALADTTIPKPSPSVPPKIPGSDLRPFLSKLAQRRVHGLAPGAIAPALEALEGAVLWTDVTGFTALAERLSARGPGGAERLSEILDTCYASILGVVAETGGDVQFFAGDGALALWLAPSPADLPAATSRANAAARRLSARPLEVPTGEASLPLRAAVGAGQLSAATVGGVGGHWCHLVGGEAVRQVALAIKGATPGQPAISPEAVALLPPAGTPVSSAPDQPVAATNPATLERFLPPPVAAALRAQQAAFLAEFRTISVVFLELSGFGWSLDLRTLQPAVVRLQQLLRDHGGLLYQLVQDDTGTTAVAVFGLPGASHDDDAVRAVRFARAARQALAGPTGAPRCGVATGPAFCGACGDASRRQYSLFGMPLHRAARLMASAAEDLLVDEPTFALGERRLSFSDHGRLSVKGFGEPLHAYRGGEVRQALPAAEGLFGRQTERLIIARRIEEYANSGEPAVLILEGPPGIGKTALLREVARCCDSQGLAMAFGTGDPLEGRTPYFALRAVLRRLLDLDDPAAGDAATAAARHLKALGEDPSLLPLLNPFLPEPVKESTLTRQLTGAVRAENRTRLVSALVAAATKGRRLVVLLDDAHWVDTPSWGLVSALRGAAPHLTWVLATRPFTSPPADFRTMTQGATWLRPGALQPQEVEAMVADLWGVTRVDPAVLAFLLERAEGNPLFCREMARSLLSAGHVRLEGGACRAAPDFGPRTASAMPATISSLIKSRLDHVRPEALLSLKAASVMGLDFEPSVLREVLEIASGDAGFASSQAEPGSSQSAELRELTGEGFVRPVPDSDGRRLQFSHASIQAVTYELLPERQRRVLHGATARALERVHAEQTAPVYGRLAHHYAEAEVLDKAAQYSALAAEQALDSYANEDAVHLYERALSFDERSRPGVTQDLGRARWYAGLAQAHYSLTHPRETGAAFARALAQAGYREPAGAGSAVLGLLGFLVRRLLGRLARFGQGRFSGDQRLRALMVVGLLPEWAALDVWEGRLNSGAAKFFASYALAERVLPSGDAAYAIGGTGYLLGMTALRGLGEAEVTRAVGLADDSGDLKARASTRVTAGMYFTIMGQPARALPQLEAAQEPAERLGAGLWKHRARFQLAEPLFMLARFPQAAAVFREAAALSTGAEPPIIGLANCLGALADVRTGDAAGALAIIDGPRGLPLFSGNYLPLQKFTALGAKIDALLRLGEVDQAVREAAAAEEMAADPAVDVFFAGLHGHAAVAEAYLTAWQRQPADATLATSARRACARLRRFAKFYPAAGPRARLLEGWRALIAGQRTRAQSRLNHAVDLASRMQSPWEAACAERLLSHLGRGDERRVHRERALALCQAHGLIYEQQALDRDADGERGGASNGAGGRETT
jgi:class 3 adenylate cyclase